MSTGYREDGGGLKCPHCGSANNHVMDSRHQGGGTRRRRRCECGHKFTTRERIESDGVAAKFQMAETICELSEGAQKLAGDMIKGLKALDDGRVEVFEIAEPEK